MDILTKQREIQLKEIKEYLDATTGKKHTDDDVLNIVVGQFHLEFYEKIREIVKPK